MDRAPTGQFILGHSPSGGRPRGSRPKLAESFIADYYDSWLKNGIAAIEAMRRKNPVAYVQCAASILPKDVNVNVSLVESMNDDELSLTIRRLNEDPDLLALDNPRDV